MPWRRGNGPNPSAGGLYPLELYVVMPNGMLHYLPDDHGAEMVTREDLRIRLAAVALGQEVLEQACGVHICGVFFCTQARYGGRAERYVYPEV